MKLRTCITLVSVAVGCLASPPSLLAQAAEKDPQSQAVGAKAPEFKLKDKEGKEHTLADLLKKGTVALVFYRSADW